MFPLHSSTRSRAFVARSSAALMVALAAAASASATIIISPSATAFTDISGTGTPVGSFSNDAVLPISGTALTSAGFNGNGLLAGNVSIAVGENGAVIWGNSNGDNFAGSTYVGWANLNITTMPASDGLVVGNGNGVRQFLAPHWDDFKPGFGSSIVWAVQSGDLIIQWNNLRHFIQNNAPITFQAVIHGGATISSGAPLVTFVYNDTVFNNGNNQNDAGSASIGYKNWGVNAGANDVEFGVGDAEGAFKVAGWVSAANPGLPHSLTISGLSPVPEPSTYAAICAVGLLGLAVRRIQQRRRAAAAQVVA